MKFNRTVAYGLACLQYLSRHRNEGWLDTRHIAQEQQLPASYCNKVLQSLVHANLVTSSRGRGFKLAKSLESINAWEIMEALTFNGAPKSPGEAMSLKLYDSLRNRVNRMLAGLTLDEVMDSVEATNKAS